MNVTITNPNIIALLQLINHDEIDFSTIDGDELIKLTSAHRITGVIYKAILQYESPSLNLIQKFKIEHQKNQFIALKQMQALTEMQQLFTANDIPMICFKGPILSYQLYGDISVRQSKDIDVLISSANIHKANEILQANGYQFCKGEQHKFQNFERVINEFKDLTYIHSKYNIQLELHWRVAPYIFNFTFTEFWQRHKLVTLKNCNFHTLSDEDYFLYLCFHGSKHAWRRLQWLCDLVRFYDNNFSQSQISEKSIQQKMKHYKIVKHVNLAVYLSAAFCPRLHKLKIITTAKPALSNYKTALFMVENCHTNLSDQNIHINSGLYQIDLVTGGINKLYYFRNKVHVGYLEWWLKRELPLQLFFICYFHLVFFIPYKLIKKLWKTSTKLWR